MKKVTKIYLDCEQPARRFECHISDAFGDGLMAEVTIWEIRNRSQCKWWQFRKRYFGSKSFWVDDYPTLNHGIDFCLRELLEEEKEDNRRRKKFEEFEKELDKLH